MCLFCASNILFFCYYGSVVYFEIRYCDGSSIAPSAYDLFGCPWSFVLTNEFLDYFTNSMRDVTRILTATALNLVDCFS